MALEKVADPGFIEENATEDFVPTLQRRDHAHSGAKTFNGAGGYLNDVQFQIWIFGPQALYGLFGFFTAWAQGGTIQRYHHGHLLESLMVQGDE
jgi:hypothetical protein